MTMFDKMNSKIENYSNKTCNCSFQIYLVVLELRKCLANIIKRVFAMKPYTSLDDGMNVCDIKVL